MEETSDNHWILKLYPQSSWHTTLTNQFTENTHHHGDVKGERSTNVVQENGGRIQRRCDNWHVLILEKWSGVLCNHPSLSSWPHVSILIYRILYMTLHVLCEKMLHVSLWKCFYTCSTMYRFSRHFHKASYKQFCKYEICEIKEK